MELWQYIQSQIVTALKYDETLNSFVYFLDCIRNFPAIRCGYKQNCLRNDFVTRGIPKLFIDQTCSADVVLV